MLFLWFVLLIKRNWQYFILWLIDWFVFNAKKILLFLIISKIVCVIIRSCEIHFLLKRKKMCYTKWCFKSMFSSIAVAVIIINQRMWIWLKKRLFSCIQSTFCNNYEFNEYIFVNLNLNNFSGGGGLQPYSAICRLPPCVFIFVVVFIEVLY